MGKAFYMSIVVRLSQSVRPLYPAVCNADGALKSVLNISVLELFFQYEFNEMFSLEHKYIYYKLLHLT